jgi:ATP-dependent helicase HrpB
VVLTAAPGAGKTTRVPPALIDAGPVILLQPRRVAARAVARRIAEERGWTLGREIGWHIRFERRFTHETRLLVVTEGILTARLQQDPLLSNFTTVVLDEFHERSIHADMGLALARQAWLARRDLRIVVMSATLDAEPIARFLGDCGVVNVPGALYPLTVEYAAGESMLQAVTHVLPRTQGQLLCFLPGAREIERTRAELAPHAASQFRDVDVVVLHGSLDGDAQDSAIRATNRRRIILATNIAETSLTVPGVTAVIDSGQVKVARYDAERGVDSLTLERVTQDSADQRAGRAARLGPGLVRRLWAARDRLRPHREPEVARVDLAAPLLDLFAWGADPRSFEWFEAPDADRLAPALRLLARLGAIEGKDGPDTAWRVTALGRQLQRLPLHPRLARILLDGKGAPEIAAACALLSEPLSLPAGARVSTSCDLLPLVDAFDRQPFHVKQVARELQRSAVEAIADGATTPSSAANRAAASSAAAAGSAPAAGSAGPASSAPPASSTDAAELRHALWVGYADRLGKRRDGDPDRVLLATGHGASLARESGVRDGDYLVALDVVASQRDGTAEARIRAASRVEREWISPTSTAVEHRIDRGTGRVRAWRVARFDDIVLGEHHVPADPVIAAGLLRDAWLAQEHDERTAQLLRRLQFAGLDVDLPAIVGEAAMSAASVAELQLESHLPLHTRRSLDERAPAALVVPSGRSMRLEYADDGSVSTSVKLQELFGLAQSPAIGPHRTLVTFHLLAPNGRPVQTTRDLRSFWERTYPEVRKELRARYPKHPWPEDPWTAQPTHRTRR